eukprot:2315017-Rhodomonas_salina.2
MCTRLLDSWYNSRYYVSTGPRIAHTVCQYRSFCKQIGDTIRSPICDSMSVPGIAQQACRRIVGIRSVSTGHRVGSLYTTIADVSTFFSTVIPDVSTVHQYGDARGGTSSKLNECSGVAACGRSVPDIA